jgi:hypothetical protein
MPTQRSARPNRRQFEKCLHVFILKALQGLSHRLIEWPETFKDEAGETLSSLINIWL